MGHWYSLPAVSFLRLDGDSGGFWRKGGTAKAEKLLVDTDCFPFLHGQTGYPLVGVKTMEESHPDLLMRREFGFCSRA